MKNIEILAAHAEVFKKMNKMDCAISVVDENGIVIQYIQATHMALKNIEVGSRVQSGSAQAEARETKKEVTRDVPSSVFGFALRAIAIPVFHEADFIGVVAAAVNLEAQEKLHLSATSIASSAQEIGATTEDVAAGAETLSANLRTLQQDSTHVLKDIKSTDDILRFVNDIAENSNLLGLNAAIEAARAGEQGRGFAVVAEEIRKMAIHSKESVEKIKTIIQSISGSTASIVSAIENTSSLSEHQAAATEQIAIAAQKLAQAAADIDDIANAL